MTDWIKVQDYQIRDMRDADGNGHALVLYFWKKELRFKPFDIFSLMYQKGEIAIKFQENIIPISFDYLIKILRMYLIQKIKP